MSRRRRQLGRDRRGAEDDVDAEGGAEIGLPMWRRQSSLKERSTLEGEWWETSAAGAGGAAGSGSERRERAAAAGRGSARARGWAWQCRQVGHAMWASLVVAAWPAGHPPPPPPSAGGVGEAAPAEEPAGWEREREGGGGEEGKRKGRG
jgi:hypothetical protein